MPPFMTKEKIIIIGVGNVLRRDDGVGVHVAKALEMRISECGMRNNVIARSVSDEAISCNLKDEIASPLARNDKSSKISIYDGGLGGFKLVDLIGGAKQAIFIDAIDMGLPPGTVKAFLPQEAASLLAAQKCSLHNSDLLDVIKFVGAYCNTPLPDNAPEIKIVGVQPANVEPGLELSVSVKDSIPRTVQLILDII
ncbi:MAG TPA: hydrogenase maturation protease [Candidatus Brocadiales bacterium]|nr:hydrogenase maturation protease [Candidatus Brocadiales bacterium]